MCPVGTWALVPSVIYSLFDFRKLRIFQCFPFPENSGLRHFPRFSYYVILLVSCLHPSLVTPSAVGNTSLSLDLQFPFALSYCSCCQVQWLRGVLALKSVRIAGSLCWGVPTQGSSGLTLQRRPLFTQNQRG